MAIKNLRFLILICNFTFYILHLTFLDNTYALNLDNLKVYLLENDYKSAILEGEKLIAQYPHSDELYYILGLSYLKDGNFLRASDIFEIILTEFKDSIFCEEAKIGLGDTYFLRGDFDQAEDCYKDLLNSEPQTKLKAQVYYRLSQIGYKKGDTQQGKEYLDKLKQDFPLNLESMLNKDLYLLSDSSSDIYYTVQVGSFVNHTNARNLLNKLNNKGYDAYMQEIDTESRKIYRVRVGKLKSLLEAIRLKDKLTQEGYPTRIVP